ncbi:GvpL/GvpF family gas vesicle protein [Sphaerisporangium fuscum]|uniref:GvpL/GvpF family gas vesicle protein n=1 Tax=Sphaerisporangium fuscum TaxID=2835868 RepID=UPI001BDD0385|nr:GvpL/GvpF family gas vesicle protein [Sphaerisporangium fuscum]
MADTGTYVYAVTREEDRAGPEVLEGLSGVAGAPVRTVPQAGLVAYVSSVPLTRFGEEPLRRSLEDLDWLGATARAHHRVVEAVARAAATAPVRLVTVYGGDDQVREMLARRRRDFQDVLARLAGRSEWGVKVYAEPPPSARAGERGAVPAGGGPEQAGRPGTEYLRRRKASLRSRDDAWREATERAEHVHAALAAVSAASTRHRPQDPQLSGRDDWMLLNGAYLVDDGRRREFEAALDALREPGVEIQLTGPWAPYSFAGFGPEAARDDPPPAPSGEGGGAR